MDTVLFNFHDIVLCVTIVLFMCFAVQHACYPLAPVRERIYFAIFCFASAAIPLDILISFGSGMRPYLVAHHPNIFFIFEIGFWLQAPFFYLFVKTHIFKHRNLSWIDLAILLPSLIFFLHQILAYHSLPTQEKIDILSNHGKAESFSIIYVVFIRELFRFCIFIVAASMIFKEFKRAAEHGLRTTEISYRLRTFGLGLSAISGLSVMNTLLMIVSFEDISPIIHGVGLTGNYLSCALVLTIVAMGNDITQDEECNASRSTTKTTNPQERSLSMEHVALIAEAMTRDKLYLDSDLTLETFSQRINLSPRITSTVINGHFHCNFSEFVNEYRIEEAKKQMRSEDFLHCTILDIMYSTGFNSKATFNAAFKKKEGITPREFRKLGAA